MPVAKKSAKSTTTELKPYWQSECGRAVVYVGDCREVMARMGRNNFHAVVTDPPYGLEFMGKEWDAPWKKCGTIEVCNEGTDKSHPFRDGTDRTRYGLSDPQGYQRWFHLCAEQMLRVAKPGAHLLSFGGTRMWHRVACAIEDAGWEVRDTIMWVYGCLSEDTEILVDGQWEPYSKAIAGRLALCYDRDYDTYSWRPIENLFIYDHDAPAVRIQSRDTDQLVSRNHRCLVEQDGDLVFREAWQIAQEREARVPVLESVLGLLHDLPVRYEGAGGTQQDVQHGVRSEVNEWTARQETNVRETDDGDYLHSVRREGMETSVAVEEGQIPDVLSAVQRKTARQRVEGTCLQGTGRLDGEINTVLQGEDVGREESSVEGWSDNIQEARQLQGSEVHQVSDRLLTDGAEGRVCDGAPSSSRQTDRQVSVESRGSPPRRPRPDKQPTEQSSTICVESRPQTVRASRYTTTDLARVTEEHYVGKMWCVKVPTGVFVARRNGKIFVTGNSGFPKGKNVSKAVDKLLGAEREKVRHPPRPDTSGTMSGSSDTRPWIEQSRIAGYHECDGDEPVTDEAKRWHGWNTALKPAYEPVILARKAFAGTVAKCAMENGTGALNVDGCRIKTTDDLGVQPTSRAPNTILGKLDYNEGGEWRQSPLGRWPANIIHDGSDEVVDLFPNTSPSTKGKPRSGVAGNGWGMTATGAEYDDSGSAARFFYTAKADDDDRPHGKGKHVTTHPTVKPLDLMRYLVRLVCAPGGTVLDPFMGSGSTGCAAVLEGMRFVGIEQSVEYADLAVGRLKLALMERSEAASAPDAATTRRAEAVAPPTARRLRG